MAKCAFCEQDARPTREHVVPDWYIQTEPGTNTLTMPRQGKVANAVAIVRDVCQVCNGGVLSQLDAYGKALYQEHFSKYILPRQAVRLNLDRERFLRWMFKVAYNSSRAQGTDPDQFRPYRPWILGRAECPRRIHLYAQLVLPAPLPDGELLFPTAFRNGWLPAQTVPAGTAFARMMSVNSYYFFAFTSELPTGAPLASWIERIQALALRRGLTPVSSLPGAQVLSASDRNVREMFLGARLLQQEMWSSGSSSEE